MGVRNRQPLPPRFRHGSLRIILALHFSFPTKLNFLEDLKECGLFFRPSMISIRETSLLFWDAIFLSRSVHYFASVACISTCLGE
jgi:hypothetical protein